MSSTRPPTLRVAVTQHEPVWLDLNATVEKTIKIIEEAAAAKAKLVVFPECWIPGYPAWIWSRPVDFDLGVKYVENSLVVDSTQMKRIQEAAATNSINVGLGYSERSGDSVYIAQALINERGELEMTRRKMKPTHMERTIFGDATGEQCLAKVVPLAEEGAEGKVTVGSLSCWEHINSLLKFATYGQNEQVHIAAWPPLDGFINGSPGLWSMSVEGCRNLSQTYAVEAQAFVLHCTTVISEKGTEFMKTGGSPIMGTPIQGSSAIIGPDGRLLSEASTANEKLIVADLDLGAVIKNKTFADAAGHYSRPDMLWLGVDKTAKPVVRPSKVI